jgi:adenine-specific DNA-methyltransferase
MLSESVYNKVEPYYLVPHLLKYMGSKREILDFVSASIDSLEVKCEWVCDLFAGTSVVSGSLAHRFKVHANDIQVYSSIFSHTYFQDLSSISLDTIITVQDDCLKLIKKFRKAYPDLDFDYSNVKSLEDLNSLESNQKRLIEKQFGLGFHLFTKNYSGTYWSFEQCLWIDTIRAIAEKYKDSIEYYVILSSLIFAMSYTSPSTGHYAQYRDVTEDNMADILTYRRKSVWDYFERKFEELVLVLSTPLLENKVTSLDYLDCLRIIEEGSIVYADPPYQSVHYSRFYHALETLVKYDYPKIAHKGRYRDDRHQSPFCKKTTVDTAFLNLFKGVSDKNSHLVLSYCDTGMISLEKIIEISKKSMGDRYEVSVLQKGHTHSTMGRNDVSTQGVTEYSINFKLNQ